MEHWFDRLSRPHSRRTSLKAAALGGATLVVPLKWWAPAASAEGARPCTPHCIEAARKAWADAADACDSRFHRGVARAGYGALLPGAGGGTVLFVLAAGRAISCNSSASLAFKGGTERCVEPHCGNPAKYPGTPKPPPPKDGCDPGYLLCGEECCDTNNAYCAGCKSGPVCCRIGGTCCPSSG